MPHLTVLLKVFLVLVPLACSYKPEIGIFEYNFDTIIEKYNSTGDKCRIWFAKQYENEQFNVLGTSTKLTVNCTINECVFAGEFTVDAVEIMLTDKNSLHHEGPYLLEFPSIRGSKWKRVLIGDVLINLCSISKRPIFSCSFDQFFVYGGLGIWITVQHSFQYKGLKLVSIFDSIKEFGTALKTATPNITYYCSNTLDAITICEIQMGSYNLRTITNLISGIGHLIISNSSHIITFCLSYPSIIINPNEAVYFDTRKDVFIIDQLVIPLCLIRPIHYEENFSELFPIDWIHLEKYDAFDLEPRMLSFFRLINAT